MDEDEGPDMVMEPINFGSGGGNMAASEMRQHLQNKDDELAVRELTLDIHDREKRLRERERWEWFGNLFGF